MKPTPPLTVQVKHYIRSDGASPKVRYGVSHHGVGYKRPLYMARDGSQRWRWNVQANDARFWLLPCPKYHSSLIWYPTCLSPPPQRIRLFSSPFCAWNIRKTLMFPSGGGESSIHDSKTHWSSFTVRINVLLTNLIQGQERLRRPVGIFGSLLPACQIMA